MINALATTTSVIDSNLITEVIGLTRSMMGLFTDFPLNVYLIGGLAFLGFGIFRSAKHSVQ